MSKIAVFRTLSYFLLHTIVLIIPAFFIVVHFFFSPCWRFGCLLAVVHSENFVGILVLTGILCLFAHMLACDVFPAIILSLLDKRSFKNRMLLASARAIQKSDATGSEWIKQKLATKEGKIVFYSKALYWLMTICLWTAAISLKYL